MAHCHAAVGYWQFRSLRLLVTYTCVKLLGAVPHVVLGTPRSFWTRCWQDCRQRVFAGYGVQVVSRWVDPLVHQVRSSGSLLGCFVPETCAWLAQRCPGFTTDWPCLTPFAGAI